MPHLTAVFPIHEVVIKLSSFCSRYTQRPQYFQDEANECQQSPGIHVIAYAEDESQTAHPPSPGCWGCLRNKPGDSCRRDQPPMRENSYTGLLEGLQGD